MISMIILNKIHPILDERMARSRRDPHSYLPLKAVDFHVLLVLTGQELHGYGIVKEIESRSGKIKDKRSDLCKSMMILLIK